MIYLILNPPRDKSGNTQGRLWIDYMESWLNNLHLCLLINFNDRWHTNHYNSAALAFQSRLSNSLAAVMYLRRKLAVKSFLPGIAHIWHTAH